MGPSRDGKVSRRPSRRRTIKHDETYIFPCTVISLARSERIGRMARTAKRYRAEGRRIARSDKTGMSISGSQRRRKRYRQPVSSSLSARHYLGRCSRKWREHPRDSFLTYRRRKWPPTRPPYRRNSSSSLPLPIPPSLSLERPSVIPLLASFPRSPSSPAIPRRSFRLSCLVRSKRLQAAGNPPLPFFAGMARISRARAEGISFFLVSGKTRGVRV